MLFIVKVPQIHIAHIEIEADNEQQAREKVQNHEGETLRVDYDRPLENCYWQVSKQ